MNLQFSAPGFLMLSASSLIMLAHNSEARNILVFPLQVKDSCLKNFLTERVRSKLVYRPFSAETQFVNKFKSGKRTYNCNVLRLSCSDEMMCGGLNPTALLLQRPPSLTLSLEEHMREHFRLTPRELEIVHLLFKGLTSKEMAQAMSVSPHTIKTFLRLIMMKMSVSTRSGIIGKVVERSLSAVDYQDS